MRTMIQNKMIHLLQRFFPAAVGSFTTTGGRPGWPMITPGPSPADGFQVTGTV